MRRFRSRRSWWLVLGVLVLLGAPAAWAALTTFTFTGTISSVSSDITAGNIQVGDPFNVVVAYEASQTTGSGTESVTSANNSGFSFNLNIDNKLTQNEADDFFGSPVLTLNNGAFDSLQFSSNDYTSLGPTTFTDLLASAPLSAQLDELQIRNSSTFEPLIVGDLTELSVSPD